MTLSQNAISRMAWNFRLNFGPVSKTSLETFLQTKLKIYGNEYSLLTHFSPVYHSI